jgi:hypothetical protein
MGEVQSDPHIAGGERTITKFNLAHSSNVWSGVKKGKVFCHNVVENIW